MFFSSAVRLAFGLALASSVAATVYDIQVGDANGDTIYTPEAIVCAFLFCIDMQCAHLLLQFANVGDQVVFHFHQKNHTATQSSFAAPCSPLEGGLNSGLLVLGIP